MENQLRPSNFEWAVIVAYFNAPEAGYKELPLGAALPIPQSLVLYKLMETVLSPMLGFV